MSVASTSLTHTPSELQPYSAPTPAVLPSKTPIVRAIASLLELELSPGDRNFLLWLRCRDGGVISAAELERVAAIQNAHQEKPPCNGSQGGFLHLPKNYDQ